jgi:predicted membrane protein
MSMDNLDPASRARRPPLTPQLVTGLLIIAVGVLFTLDNLGIAHAAEYTRYWPAGLIVIGLLKVWQSREGSGSGVGGLIFTLIGFWLLLEQLTVIRISFADMWPMVLVFLGGYLVWQGVTGRRARPERDAAASVNAVAVLGGVVRGSASRNFRGGELTAVMGGCEIDLRQAAINGEAIIDVFALWGGIEIKVPDDWVVLTRVTPILGGVEDKTRPSPGAGAHRLTLRGMAIMGGVEVKN